jgi:hypothetical protein
MGEYYGVEIGDGPIGALVDGHLYLDSHEVIWFLTGFEHETCAFGYPQALLVAVEPQIGRADDVRRQGNGSRGLQRAQDHFEFPRYPEPNLQKVERGPEQNERVRGEEPRQGERAPERDSQNREDRSKGNAETGTIPQR